MKESTLNALICPLCKKELSIESKAYGSSVTEKINKAGEIKEGTLRCRGCSNTFPIKNYIPRFVNSDNYTSSFGMQWNLHARTQLDKFNGTSISKDRFFNETNWSAKDMKGQKVLEVGCGAGRFTQVVLDTGATCFSVDYSSSVNACWANSGSSEQSHLFQADIYHLPFKENFFDKVFCFGVLQHTPDVSQAFFSLLPFLKSGGEIAVDMYASPFSYFHPRHLFRPITTRMRKDKLYITIVSLAPYLLSLSILLKQLPLIGMFLARLIPVANYKGILPLSKPALKEWAVLDTFDWLATKYDQPQTLGTLRQWFTKAKLSQTNFKRIRAVYVGKGIKSHTALA